LRFVNKEASLFPRIRERSLDFTYQVPLSYTIPGRSYLVPATIWESSHSGNENFSRAYTKRSSFLRIIIDRAYRPCLLLPSSDSLPGTLVLYQCTRYSELSAIYSIFLLVTIVLLFDRTYNFYIYIVWQNAMKKSIRVTVCL